MPEQLQKILNQFLDWWKKFSTKQKALLISIAATIILALVILAVVVGKPTMVPLVQCESTAEAAKIKEILDGDNSISYNLSDDGLAFYVDEKNKAQASLLLGTNNIPTQGPDINDVFSGGFSATEADKNKKYKDYMQQYMEEQLEWLSNVERASVTLDLPKDDGTILAKEEDAYASVILTLSGAMDEDQAAGIAKYVATQLGNDTTDHVLILDSNSNVLFDGGDSSTVAGTANSQLSIRAKAENMVISRVRDVMVGASIYDHVEVAPKLEMDFDSLRELEILYFPPDGQTNGMIGEQSNYESNSIGGEGGVPGTDANGDNTTYVLQDNNYTETNVTDSTIKYQNNQKTTDRTAAAGKIDYTNCSIAIVAKNYAVYDEDVLKASGALNGMTFDEYIAANSAPVKTTVDPDYYTMISNATGFPVDKISIIAYTEPIFQYSSNQRSIRDFLPIILAVLIFLLLGYVVFRSTRKEKVVEAEPELSVENLLESTKENQEQLENIGYNEKSETRLLIEKFVEENPEAAASLLRNWLNEEWE